MLNTNTKSENSKVTLTKNNYTSFLPSSFPLIQELWIDSMKFLDGAHTSIADWPDIPQSDNGLVLLLNATKRMINQAILFVNGCENLSSLTLNFHFFSMIEDIIEEWISKQNETESEIKILELFTELLKFEELGTAIANCSSLKSLTIVIAIDHGITFSSSICHESVKKLIWNIFENNSTLENFHLFNLPFERNMEIMQTLLVNRTTLHSLNMHSYDKYVDNTIMQLNIQGTVQTGFIRKLIVIAEESLSWSSIRFPTWPPIIELFRKCPFLTSFQVKNSLSSHDLLSFQDQINFMLEQRKAECVSGFETKLGMI